MTLLRVLRDDEIPDRARDFKIDAYWSNGQHISQTVWLRWVKLDRLGCIILENDGSVANFHDDAIVEHITDYDDSRARALAFE